MASNEKLKKKITTLRERSEKIRQELNLAEEKAFAYRAKNILKDYKKIFADIFWHPHLGYGGSVSLQAYFRDHSDGLCLAKAEAYPEFCKAFDLDPEEVKYSHRRCELKLDGYDNPICVHFDDNFFSIQFHNSADSVLFAKNFELQIADTFLNEEIERLQGKVNDLVAFKGLYVK